MSPNRGYTSLMAWLLLPFIIYCYFLNWRTNFIYGDDISIYAKLASLEGFKERVNMGLDYGKFRPIQGLATQFLIDLFKKDLNLYYLFNICIQAINTFILAKMLNLYLRSSWLSLFFSLVMGISRFAFFNISQLFNGGALEGLAMTFFLLSLYFIVSISERGENITAANSSEKVLLSIFFANLSMYTHERYIVIFPFLLLTILFFPGLRGLARKRKISLMLIAVASIVLNVGLKKYVYSMPFFVGTGGTNISFSFSSAFSFLMDAILSIFQVNSGPGYLVGVTFSYLPVADKVLVLLFLVGLAFIFIAYILKVRRRIIDRQQAANDKLYIMVLLACLFALFLAPAIVTIRLEQRWLQASQAVFILMIGIAFSELEFSTRIVRNGFMMTFVCLFLWTNHNYFYKGAESLYMVDSERLVTVFGKAVREGVIRDKTERLYIWEKQRDANTEAAIKWDLGMGSFFEFYQSRAKKIIFVDSVYEKGYAFPFLAIRGFDPNTDQIIYINGRINEVTDYFLKDSLQYFSAVKSKELDISGKATLFPKNLAIRCDDLDRMSISGFYVDKQGVRWTNGNATIGFSEDYSVKDSIHVRLQTYLPSVCKDIYPRVVFKDADNKVYEPVYSTKRSDCYEFAFYFDRFTTVQAINIISDTIRSSVDQRKVSFPFLRMDVDNR